LKSISILVLLIAITQAQNADVIKSLPGLSEKLNFNQYSGYLQSNHTQNRNLFYWFVESQSNPKSDPVVLWLNGGPGCSSLDGLLTEHGPFLVNEDGKTLRVNPHSWNKVANVLYLESPANVGFSYSASQESEYNDDKTADDVYNFLLQFFKKYPQFSKNKFFVSGESYAGHYVPVCSAAIFDGNKRGGNTPINLEGFLVGNGVTDQESDQNSVPTFIYQHALTSQEDYERAVSKCKGDFYKHSRETECMYAMSRLRSSIGNINIYDIYSPCYGVNNKANGRCMMSSVLTPWRREPGCNLSPPCIDSKDIISYLNIPEVKDAIHARKDIAWDICNDVVNANYNWTYESMLPFYTKLLAGGVRAIVYSGDADLAVNQLGSQTSVNKLQKSVGASITKVWASWSVSGSTQVAGYVKQWNNNLTYLTVKGAGHMVPTSKPEESLYFFTKFIRKEDF